jgi:hypothetical protein
MRSRVFSCLVLVAMCAPVPALAHHSTANFDMQKSNTISGTVKYFSFTNPHSFIDLEVTDKSGAAHAYKVFTVARVVMLRTGWASGDLKAGDKVTVTGNPDRKDPSYLYLQKIVFPSGKFWSNDNVQR